MAEAPHSADSSTQDIAQPGHSYSTLVKMILPSQFDMTETVLNSPVVPVKIVITETRSQCSWEALPTFPLHNFSGAVHSECPGFSCLSLQMSLDLLPLYLHDTAPE